jgi:hypothetical protein
LSVRTPAPSETQFDHFNVEFDHLNARAKRSSARERSGGRSSWKDAVRVGSPDNRAGLSVISPQLGLTIAPPTPRGQYSKTARGQHGREWRKRPQRWFGESGGSLVYLALATQDPSLPGREVGKHYVSRWMSVSVGGHRSTAAIKREKGACRRIGRPVDA